MDTFILAATCTPLGVPGGHLKGLSAPSLGAIVLAEALQRSAQSLACVDEVLMGCVVQAGMGPNPARQAARLAGLPQTIPALTVNTGMASGLDAVCLATQHLAGGYGRQILAGGMESASQAPYLLPAARWGVRMGETELLDALLQDGLPESSARDNLHGFADGAAALLLASEPLEGAVPPLARILGWTRSWGDTPVASMREALGRLAHIASLPLSALQLAEVDGLDLDQLQHLLPGLEPGRVNPRSDAAPLGCPLGAHGARMLVTLLHALDAQALRYGLVALADSDGMSLAMMIERS